MIGKAQVDFANGIAQPKDVGGVLDQHAQDIRHLAHKISRTV